MIKYIRYGWWQVKEKRLRMEATIRKDFTGKTILEHLNLKEIKESAMQIPGNKSFSGSGRGQ